MVFKTASQDGFQRTLRVMFPLMLSALFLLCFAGCDLSSPSEDDSTPDGPEEFSLYVANSGLDGGVVTPYPELGTQCYTIMVPGKTWSSHDTWHSVYLLQQSGIVRFEVFGYLEDPHNSGNAAIVGLTETSLGGEAIGPVVWTENENLTIIRPYHVQVSNEIRTAISDHLRSEANAPDSLDIAIHSLGMSGNGALFWANSVFEGTVNTYDASAAELPGWIIQLDIQLTPYIQATFHAPGGFGCNKLVSADMNNDGIADLVCIGLHAPASPTRVYYFASDHLWHWVGEYDAIQ